MNSASSKKLSSWPYTALVTTTGGWGSGSGSGSGWGSGAGAFLAASIRCQSVSSRSIRNGTATAHLSS